MEKLLPEDRRMLDYYKEFPLWEGEAPLFDREKAAVKENITDNKTGGVNRVANVSCPTVTFYPAYTKEPAPCVLICPGGGYTTLAWEHEGIGVAHTFNTMGYSAFILKYRCPDQREAAFADAARAVRFIRYNSERFHIDPEKVGVIGFSAGGHLAAVVSSPASLTPYEEKEEMDSLSFRPDFSILIYPAYLLKESGKTGELAGELKVDENTPPTFLFQAQDDFVGVETSIGYYLALTANHVPGEMHLFSKGAHGYGIRPVREGVSTWPRLLEKWLIALHQ